MFRHQPFVGAVNQHRPQTVVRPFQKLVNLRLLINHWSSLFSNARMEISTDSQTDVIGNNLRGIFHNLF